MGSELKTLYEQQYIITKVQNGFILEIGTARYVYLTEKDLFKALSEDFNGE